MGWIPQKHLERPYFAHPVNTYGTPLEAAIVGLIAEWLNIHPEDVENPNQPHHQVGYNEYAARARQADTTHKGMNYFYDCVLPSCDSCVAMPFLDGRMGLGVAGEAKWFIECDKPVYAVRVLLTPPDEQIIDQFCKGTGPDLFRIALMGAAERELILTSNERWVVPHIETRLRTWIVYNRTMPYHEAHHAHMPLPDDFYPVEK